MPVFMVFILYMNNDVVNIICSNRCHIFLSERVQKTNHDQNYTSHKIKLLIVHFIIYIIINVLEKKNQKSVYEYCI